MYILSILFSLTTADESYTDAGQISSDLSSYLDNFNEALERIESLADSSTPLANAFTDLSSTEASIADRMWSKLYYGDFDLVQQTVDAFTPLAPAVAKMVAALEARAEKFNDQASIINIRSVGQMFLYNPKEIASAYDFDGTMDPLAAAAGNTLKSGYYEIKNLGVTDSADLDSYTEWVVSGSGSSSPSTASVGEEDSESSSESSESSASTTATGSESESSSASETGETSDASGSAQSTAKPSQSSQSSKPSETSESISKSTGDFSSSARSSTGATASSDTSSSSDANTSSNGAGSYQFSLLSVIFALL